MSVPAPKGKPRPRRDLAWLRSESTPFAITAVALGNIAFFLLVIGTLVVLLANGLTPTANLIRGFKSNEINGICIGSIAIGVAAMVMGWGFYRRMPTKVSREECIAGAVLGLEAVIGAAVLLYFAEGDVEVFAINFLDFKVIGPQIDAFINGVKNTLIMALSGEFFGIVLGLILAIFAISKRSVVRAPARTYINFFRGTPLVWQIIFIGTGIPIALALNIQPYTAMIVALSLNAGAYTAEVFRAGIQSIERGQLEAARGLGMSYMQAMRYAVIPQAFRRVIPPLMNEFVILIKDTSLVIVLGLTQAQRDIMSVGNQGVQNTFNASFLIATALGYLVVSLPAIRLVNMLERRLRSGLVGVGG